MGLAEFINNTKNVLNETKNMLTDSVKKFMNKDFLDAVVAGCALVAAADGKIDSSEKNKMIGYIQRSEELKVFETMQVISRFNHFIDGFEFDLTIGQAEALKAIAKMKSNSEAARTLVSVCCAIGMADGDFDHNERKVVQVICRELNLNPDEFDL